MFICRTSSSPGKQAARYSGLQIDPQAAESLARLQEPGNLNAGFTQVPCSAVILDRFQAPQFLCPRSAMLMVGIGNGRVLFVEVAKIQSPDYPRSLTVTPGADVPCLIAHEIMFGGFHEAPGCL